MITSGREGGGEAKAKSILSGNASPHRELDIKSCHMGREQTPHLLEKDDCCGELEP